ncbi:MAG: type II and III secretion system protein family protein [Candidatus Omnitrophica bacterium]|nr:type II and III secretion system protein family protein [Candidatus Omnitrophota bacterium]
MLYAKEIYHSHFLHSSRSKRLIDTLCYVLLFCCAGAFAMLFFASNGWALPTIDELLPSNEQLTVVVNKSALVKLNQPVKRVSIVAPDIADVQILEEKQILVTAQSVGETTLVIWQEDGSVRTIDVIVEVNTKQLSDTLLYTMPDEAIEVVPMNQGVALRGQIQEIGKVDQAMSIASSYSEEVVNLMDVPGVHQVMLKVRIAEVARSFSEEAGVNFQILDDSFQGTNVLGGLVSGNLNSPDLSVSDAVTMFLGFPKSDVNVFIQALQERGLLQILAEPNLVARSGETASFLAGGEFPVPIVQGGISDSISVEYKEFGVRLTFTPTVLSPRDIRLDLSPEVSDLDFAQGVVLSGFQIPTVITRRVQTVVHLKDGQSFAIAGLLSKNKQKNHRKVPFVGDIPLLGGLFRGSELSEDETELLIMVTPHLVAPLLDGPSYPMPGDSLKGLESDPFAPDGDKLPPSVDESASIDEPAIHDKEIPTLYPQNNVRTMGSKTRTIRSANAGSEAPSVNLRQGRIIDSLHSTEPDVNSSMPAASSIPDPKISAPSDAPIEENQSVEPVTRADIEPAEIEEAEKTVEDVLPDSDYAPAPSSYPNMVSQAGYSKPGLMPAGVQDPERPVIASDRRKRSDNQAPAMNSENEKEEADQEAGAVLASRFGL